MGKLLTKITLSTLLIGTTFSAGSCGKHQADLKYDKMERIEKREYTNRTLGYLVYGGVAAVTTFALGLGVVNLLLSDGREEGETSHERDPTKDDPGAFGPGGLRY